MKELSPEVYRVNLPTVFSASNLMQGRESGRSTREMLSQRPNISALDRRCIRLFAEETVGRFTRGTSSDSSSIRRFLERIA
jgi:hypothetical protein